MARIEELGGGEILVMLVVDEVVLAVVEMEEDVVVYGCFGDGGDGVVK